MSINEGTPEFDHGARRLQGAMLEHPNLAIERMPGLSYALNRFIAETPERCLRSSRSLPAAQSKRFVQRHCFRQLASAPA